MVLFAYLRPVIFETFKPREGYDPLKKPTANDMGWDWFIIVFGTLFSMATLWYVILEIFRISEFFLIIRNLVMTVLASGITVAISQFFFFNERRK